ncbi:MAG TPA: DNA gyrase subunit A [Kiritimatiellia bacterium]|nr:DNA gyrase subunit A [Kiritimatiellia bacterium]
MDTPPNAADRIDPINIEDEMQKAYIDYSMSVIIGRALPDARDGLKPVHRRILYAMYDEGLLHNKRYSKCAGVVGEVLKKYHPHGDASVYDALVRLAQPWNMRYTLVEGQGNFGSIDGDPPAAYRYTECRLEALAEEMLRDIDKNTVDMQPNFDEQTEEPKVLPCRAPNLLVNGSTGIAVGMASNIPPHNLGEVVDACVHLIDQPEATIDALMGFVKGPDFPTGGVIHGVKAIRQMYETGRGLLKVRGRATIEESASREAIIITEIPYAVNKATLIEKMADLVREKQIDGISDIRDESDENIRIVVELKRGVVGQVVLNNLFRQTQMETTFGAIMLAIDKGRPRVLNLKQILTCYLDHRFEVTKRRLEFDLAKAEARAHILEGLKIALDNLDAVVKIIRESKNRDEARGQLISRFGLSEIQANAILDMRLYQLTGLERDKIEAEYLELIKLINYLRDLLASERKIYNVIKEDLLEIRKLYADERRTAVVPDEGEIAIEDLIADRGCIITLTHGGYIKRMPISTFRQQKRGGKGVVGMDTKEEDYVEHVFTASTHDHLLFFTQHGRVHWKKVHEVPEAGRAARGKALVNFLEISNEEKIAALIRVREFPETQFLVFATEKGLVKKTNLAAFGNPRAGGIIAISVEEGDRLIGVRLTGGNDELMLVTRHGMSIRFAETQLRDQGRDTVGVWGIQLDKENDAVVSIETVDPATTLLCISENGYGKRTAFDEYPSQKRAGKGVIAMKTSDRNGALVGAHAVGDKDALMLITEQGQMIRIGVHDVRLISRNTQGVRIINLDKDDRVVSATPVEPDDEDAPSTEGEIVPQGGNSDYPILNPET